MKSIPLFFLCILTTLCAQAFSWKAKSIAAEKAALVARLKSAGDVSVDAVRAPDRFASALEAQPDRLAWLQAAIDYGQALLKETEGRDATDPLRRLALEVIDFPLHVDNYNSSVTGEEMKAFNDMVIGYSRGARDRVLREVKSAKVPEGELWIWRIYNMAFVLKGPRHTVAIDFTPRPTLIAKPYAELIKDFNAVYKSGTGPKTFDAQLGAPKVWSDDDWKAFAEVVDLAVLTHPHGDHTSEPFLREMMRRGKPIVLPGDVMAAAAGDPTKRQPFTTGPTCIKLTEDHAEPVEVAGIRIRNFRGYQDSVPCNVYLLDIDGVRVADNGDNYDRGKEKCLSEAPPADVIIASTWNSVHHILDCVQKAPGFDVEHSVFIPAHENELGHSVNHRESYLEMYTDPNRLGNLNFPLTRTFPLGWGEKLVYRK